MTTALHVPWDTFGSGCHTEHSSTEPCRVVRSSQAKDMRGRTRSSARASAGQCMLPCGGTFLSGVAAGPWKSSRGGNKAAVGRALRFKVRRGDALCLEKRDNRDASVKRARPQ